MEETKVWKIVMVAICIVIATMGGCQGTINYQDNTAMVDMVNKGADPLDARCAIKSSDNSMCAIRAASKKQMKVANVEVSGCLPKDEK